ncbi:MAG: hypothetical protein IT344_04770 [Candidatus Dadabacteria bacterium]|nr:hypothetical protein [Candidatus Dadabacteria bacterium]
MRKEEIDKIIEAWKSYLLQGQLEGYELEIDKSVPMEFAAIALHLDVQTVRAAGQVEEYYEGYRQAAVDVLNIMGVEIAQDDHSKVISLFKKASDDDKQEELMKHIWG